VIIAVLVTVFAAWVLWTNKALEITEYEVQSEKIPESFDGFRITQVSDLHNDSFGEDNCKLLDLLRETEPDIIVITGDLVDSRRTDMAIGLDFARQALGIAPVYYVPGNHESRLTEYEGFRQDLLNAGVTVMDNRKLGFEREDQSITLMGVNDPHFWYNWPPVDDAVLVYNAISRIQEFTDGYTVLLSHRPDLMGAYVQSGMDLVLSGHAHGGQFRIPFVGGLFAPDQGLFPKYDAGRFDHGDTTLIVSRGLGASVIPFRINNRPEIVVVTLHHE
jgi:predicted MPP superfamily phosphohydrolase